MAYKQKHPKCKEKGCPSLRHCKGLCKAHYRRLTGELSGPVKHYTRNRGAMCRLVCDKPAYALGLCKAHYHRHRNGTSDWYGPLAHRRPDKGLPFGRVWISPKYAALFERIAQDRGMTLNRLATNILESYARSRLSEKESLRGDELTIDTWSRRD